MSPTGYTTNFFGEFTVEPPLNSHEVAYLNDFAGTRRMDREEGPYFAKQDGTFGQVKTPGVRNYNSPPAGQPGLWCQWVPSNDGATIEWDQGEKFYNSVEWVEYLIEHFLKPGAVAHMKQIEAIKQDPRLAHFTFDHVVNGEVFAQGEESGDHWKLVVENNVVKTAQAQVIWPDPT